MKKVFLDNLPKWEGGKGGGNGNKGKIKWKDSIGYKVKFIYDDIEGEVEIVDYQQKSQYLYIKYLNKPIFRIKTMGFQKCQLSTLLGVASHEIPKFKLKIGDIINDTTRDLTIIDREFRVSKDRYGWNKNLKYYKYKCNKCGYENWVIESSLKRGHGCPVCCEPPVVVVEGINSIVDTAPWMIPYFQGGYDEAKLYTKSSSKKIQPICPDCGRVKDKMIIISSIYNNHSIGCSCGDGMSYPEKIMFNILEQLQVNFENQLTRNTFDWCDNYKYDFCIPSLNCIIETHGGQHYAESNRGRSLKEEIQNDKLKEELAKENRITHYIIIDCRYSELEYIKNSVLNSGLSNLFDLSKINWLKCEEFALSNLCKKACELKRDNPNMTTTDIGKIIKLNGNTVRTYLRKGAKLGWCDYDAKQESKKKCTSDKPVEVLKNGISLGVFPSYTILDGKSEELFGVKLEKSSISKVCRGEKKQYKGFTFKNIDNNNINYKIDY